MNLYTSQQATTKKSYPSIWTHVIGSEFKMLFVRFDEDKKSLILRLVGQMAGPMFLKKRPRPCVVSIIHLEVCLYAAIDKLPHKCC